MFLVCRMLIMHYKCLFRIFMYKITEKSYESGNNFILSPTLAFKEFPSLVITRTVSLKTNTIQIDLGPILPPASEGWGR